MDKEVVDKITSEIQQGINKVRESIKAYGATIPKSEIVVFIRDNNGVLKAIKTVDV